MEFDNILKSEKVQQPHPYNLTVDQRREFAGVLRGAKPSGLNGSIFRLNSLRKLLERPDVRRRPERTESPDELFQAVFQEFERRGRQPLPLTWIVQEGSRLEGLRKIDFWTDLDLRAGDITRDAYRIGLPRNFFPEDDPIVLICPTQIFSRDEPRLLGPTVLDGYDFGPFFTIAEGDQLDRGHTLDLQDLADLKQGVTEFVSSSLPVEELSFVPIGQTPIFSFEHSFQANSPLVESLREFFRSQ
jgi:hypothetical protein